MMLIRHGCLDDFIKSFREFSRLEITEDRYKFVKQYIQGQELFVQNETSYQTSYQIGQIVFTFLQGLKDIVCIQDNPVSPPLNQQGKTLNGLEIILSTFGQHNLANTIVFYLCIALDQSKMYQDRIDVVTEILVEITSQNNMQYVNWLCSETHLVEILVSKLRLMVTRILSYDQSEDGQELIFF